MDSNTEISTTELQENVEAKAQEKPPEYMVISKITNKIFIGSCEHPLNFDNEFKQLEFTAIINCAEEVDYDHIPGNIVYRKLNFESGPYPSLLEHIDETDEIISRLIRSGKKIYIHCDQGTSRAPAIVIYYLMKSRSCTYDRAFEFVKKARPMIDIHPDYERELRTFDEEHF
jgi:protein-tyrosine phosphatase